MGHYIIYLLLYSQVAECSGSGAARDIVNNLSKPTGPESRVISKLFSNSSTKVGSFDPVMPSVNTDKKRKKQKAKPPSTKKPKATTKTVIMLPEGELKVSTQCHVVRHNVCYFFVYKVPKGERRKELEKTGRVQCIKIDRCMEHQEVKEAILHEFKWVKSFSVLTPDPKTRGNSLKMDNTQNPDGNYIVERRGCLYVTVEEGDEYIVSLTYLHVVLSK